MAARELPDQMMAYHFDRVAVGMTQERVLAGGAIVAQAG
jgi:hypothetical protein